MRPQNNRLRCYQDEAVLSFDEMTNLLQSDTRIPIQVYEAIIISWINLLRSEVLQLAANDHAFFLSLQNGQGVLRLRRSLIPLGWTKDSFGNQIAQRTGLSYSTVCFTFQKMSEILANLNRTKAFEPIGWFEVVPKAEGGGFIVYLWEDFPQPASYKYEQDTHPSGQLV